MLLFPRRRLFDGIDAIYLAETVPKPIWHTKEEPKPLFCDKCDILSRHYVALYLLFFSFAASMAF